MLSQARLARRWAAAARASIPLIVAFVYSSSAVAATITYTNRAAFEATLGTKVTDDYSSAGYNVDNDVNTIDILNNIAMSAVLGETDYTTTGFANLNIIVTQASDPTYCAGCNGSYLLGFTTTSVGTASGVFGAGFDFTNSASLYHAFVTFGDATTADFALPGGGFIGITSDLLISSVHLGLINGGVTTSGSFTHDNLTFGSVIPEPSSTLLFAAGALVVGVALRKKAVA